jgi:hypothetical protein
VYIWNRLTEDATLYSDIDLLVSCSEFESGPLGIFEAASCGVPVLTRPVGNTRHIQGIRVFNTTDEAIDILNIWNGNVDALRVYANEVTNEVRTNWSMYTLIHKHLMPIFNNSQTLDFIEIGTSDFDTEIQNADGRTGLSVEPIYNYLNALPDVEGVTKVHAAISNYDGDLNVYSVTPELIKKYDLPDWVRGCNTINNYHPTVLKLILDKRLDEREVFTVERVPVMTFSTLIKKHNVHGCRYLKIDTEGHDVVIIDSYLDCVVRGEISLIPKILFETNELIEHEVVKNILEKLSTFGYKVTLSGYNTIVELR